MNVFTRHSPTTCQMSHGGTIASGFAAGIAAATGQPSPEPEPFVCACRCSDCRSGQCSIFGNRAQTEAFAEARRQRLLRQKTFYDYDVKAIGRTLESFRYHIEFLHSGDPVDDFYTDLPSERDRLIEAAEDQGYGVRITYGVEWEYPEVDDDPIG